MNARGFHVYAALEAGVGLEAIREALPVGTPLRAVALAEAGRPGNEIEPRTDLVIVGCSYAHDQALEVISAAAAQRGDRPVVVLYQGSPNGFLAPASSGSRWRRRSRAAAAPPPGRPRGR